MNIPFVDLNAQYQSLKSEIDQAVRRVIVSSSFTLGDAVTEFERAFATYCGVNHCVGVNNGTNALLLALKALDIGRDDDVIAPANTFFATIEAIIHAGARPVLADVNADSKTIDVDLLNFSISRRTKAIIPVHLYGRMAEMDTIQNLANKHGFKVIEDAAQAHGATYKKRMAGSIGQASAFSFYPSKNLGAFGEGGAVTTNDPDVAEKIRMLRDHGSKQKYHHDLVGYNARMEGIQGAVLGVKLKYLAQWNDARRQVAAWYRQALHGLPLSLPVDAENDRQVYHLFVITCEQRDALREHLQRHGVATGLHYPVPIHLQPACEYLGYRKGDFPVSEQLADQCLSLPIYPELTQEQVSFIADRIREFYRG